MSGCLTVYVRRLKTIRRADNKYDAVIDLTVSGRELKVVIPHLTRNPSNVRLYEELGSIRFELLDSEGKGFATCIISSKVFESGCKELICRGHTWIITEEHIREHCIS